MHCKPIAQCITLANITFQLPMLQRSLLGVNETEEVRDCLVTYPPGPLMQRLHLPIMGRGSVGKRGAKPLSKVSSPSP